MSRLKTFKFKIFEHWFGGTNERILEVKAAHAKSALKKCIQIQGNRSWEIVPLETKRTFGIVVTDQGEFPYDNSDDGGAE